MKKRRDNWSPREIRFKTAVYWPPMSGRDTYWNTKRKPCLYSHRLYNHAPSQYERGLGIDKEYKCAPCCVQLLFGPVLSSTASGLSQLFLFMHVLHLIMSTPPRVSIATNGARLCTWIVKIKRSSAHCGSLPPTTQANTADNVNESIKTRPAVHYITCLEGIVPWKYGIKDLIGRLMKYNVSFDLNTNVQYICVLYMRS